MPINRGLKRPLPTLPASATAALLTEPDTTRTGTDAAAEHVVLGGCQVDSAVTRRLVEEARIGVRRHA